MPFVAVIKRNLGFVTYGIIKFYAILPLNSDNTYMQNFHYMFISFISEHGVSILSEKITIEEKHCKNRVL